jgi:hypothetical protein
MPDGDLAEPFERAAHVGGAILEEDALPVVRVRAHADVRGDAQLGDRLFHRADRARDDVVALARDERARVLPIRRAEDEEAGEPRGRGGASVAHELGEREALELSGAFDPLAILDRGRHDDRQDHP